MTYNNDMMSAANLESMMARGRTERAMAFRKFFSGAYNRIAGLIRHDVAADRKLGATCTAD